MNLVALAVAASLLAPQAAKKDPKEEFQMRWTSLARRVSQQHTLLARKFTERKVHEMAWEEWQRAAELDPANAEAERALGRKFDKEKNEWVDSGAAKPKKNEGKDGEARQRSKECSDDRRVMAAKAIADFEQLADWAEANGLKDEARSLWKRVLRDYDGREERALKATGWIEEDGRWLSPEDVEKRDAGKKKLEQAGEGAPFTEKSALERALNWTLEKRRGPHCFIEGPYSEDEIKELVRVCEATRSLYLELFHLGEMSLSRTIHAIALKEQSQYDAYLEKTPDLADAQRGSFKGVSGFITPNLIQFVHWQGPRTWAAMRDNVAHMTGHLCLFQMTGLVEPPPWLQEGIAYTMSERVLQTALVQCVRSETSTGGAETRGPIDVLDWRRQVKEDVTAKRCPPLREAMFSSMSTLTAEKLLKAMSVIDFLLSEHVDEFRAFLTAIKAKTNQEEAMTKAFGGKSLVEIDALWLAFVKDKY